MIWTISPTNISIVKITIAHVRLINFLVYVPASLLNSLSV
jgi:hypothetical protein